ncbi:alpha/beta hydrolase [Allosphingosinicella deserti]|nr:alpha/beta hydrolase [Sphingomonas deserti]
MPHRMLLLAAALLLSVHAPVAAQSAEPVSVPLWPAGAPGSEAHRGEPERIENTYVHNVHAPSLTVYPAAPGHANGSAVIVVPGGGHHMLVWINEGVGPAKALNRYGVTTFVLKYRLAREPGSTYAIEREATADLARAVRWVRSHAAEYGIDPARIGVMGFSAGGELVSLVADNPLPAMPAMDAIDRASARPDFQILIYPGPLGTPARLPAGAPPAFLAAGSLDACCTPPVMTLYTQLRNAGVSAELHLFADTDHGFNLGTKSERISILHWPDRLADWMSDGGWFRSRTPTKP